MAISTNCCSPIRNSRDAALGVDVDAEAPQKRVRGLHDAPPVDDGPEDQRFAAEKNIVGRRQLGDEVEFLVDDRDARAFGVLHAGETNRRSGKPDRAFVFDMHAGEDFHQSRFAGAVLAHQRMHFAAHQVEVDVAQGLDSGERFGDAFGFQNDGVVGLTSDRRRQGHEWKRRASSCLSRFRPHIPMAALPVRYPQGRASARRVLLSRLVC